MSILSLSHITPLLVRASGACIIFSRRLDYCRLQDATPDTRCFLNRLSSFGIIHRSGINLASIDKSSLNSPRLLVEFEKDPSIGFYFQRHWAAVSAAWGVLAAAPGHLGGGGETTGAHGPRTCLAHTRIYVYPERIHGYTEIVRSLPWFSTDISTC